MVLIGCIRRSWGHKIGFQNAIFISLPVWNKKAQSFNIWYITLFSGPPPMLFKLCPQVQNRPHPSGHNFTLNLSYKENIKQLLLLSHTYRNLTKLNRNGPWVVPYQNSLKSSDWLLERMFNLRP